MARGSSATTPAVSSTTAPQLKIYPPSIDIFSGLPEKGESIRECHKKLRLIALPILFFPHRQAFMANRLARRP